MGLIGAAFGLGFVVGPAIGGLSSRWGESAPGLVASSLTAANFLLALWKLPEPAVHRDVVRDTAVAHWTRFAQPFAAVALSTVAFTVMYVVFPLQVERALGYTRHQTAYFFVLIGIVSAVVQGWLVGRLAPRFGETALMTAGGWLLLLGMGGLAFTLGAPSPDRQVLNAVLGSLVLVGLGSGLIGPSATGYVSRAAAAAEQGRALGLLQSVGSVARVVGPALAGGLTHFFGAKVAFLVAAGAAGAAGLAPVFGRDRSRAEN
jgi:MFS family permease